MCEISIIVPVYNVEKYLNKCVDSILNQTFRDFELILVDDGSPDNSGAICDQYAEQDSRVKVIHNENRGISEARNSGINIAKGKYYGFVDSDDYIAEDMFEILYKNIRKYNADISSVELISVQNGVLKTKNKKNVEKVYNQKETMQAVIEGTDFYAYVWNKLYLSSLFKDIRFPKGKTFEDAIIMFKLLKKVNKVVICNMGKYYYVRHHDSIMGSDYSDATYDVVEAWKENNKIILKLYPELNKSCRKRMCWAYFFVLDKALLSNNSKNNSVIVNISKKLLKERAFILKYPNFTLNRKLSIIALSININFYKWLVIKQERKLYN